MKVENKYKFSFTAVSLRTKDLVEVANWNDKKEIEELQLLIGNGKSATGKRLWLEFNKWLKVLTSEELEILKSGSFKAQNEIAFLAVCKYYKFIRDFMVELVREKYLVFDYELTDGDYLSFFRSKAEINTEMDSLTEITQRKVKQVVFRMLEQANIIVSVKSRQIKSQVLELETQRAIVKDNPEWLKVFLYEDYNINQLKEIHA